MKRQGFIERTWLALGGRKFFGFEQILLTILGLGYFVRDYRALGVLCGAVLLAYLIYTQANVRGKFKIGESEFTTGGNDGDENEEGTVDPGDSSADPGNSGSVGHVGRQGQSNRQPQD